MAIYDDHTTAVTANKPPVLEVNRCNLTGPWKLPLHPEGIAANKEPPHGKAINVIFDLPSAHQNSLYYHAVTGFHTKRNLHQGRLQPKLCNVAKTHHPTHAQIHARFKIQTGQQKGTSRANAKGADQQNRKLSKK